MALQKGISKKRMRDTESYVFKSSRRKRMKKLRRMERHKYRKRYDLDLTNLDERG